MFMWDNFLGAQTRGEMCDCICPSRLGQRIKKQQLTRRGGRQRGWRSEKGRTGEEGTFVRLRLFGREVLPAHLSARLPAARHTQMCTCIWVVMHTKMSTHRHINRQTRVHEDWFTKCNKGLIDHVLKFLEYIKIDVCICPTLTEMV